MDPSHRAFVIIALMWGLAGVALLLRPFVKPRMDAWRREQYSRWLAENPPPGNGKRP